MLGLSHTRLMTVGINLATLTKAGEKVSMNLFLLALFQGRFTLPSVSERGVLNRDKQTNKQIFNAELNHHNLNM